MLETLDGKAIPELNAVGDQDAVRSLRVKAATLSRDGHRYRRACQDALHADGSSFLSVDWLRFDEWSDEAAGMASFFSLPPEQRRRIMEA